MAEARRIKLKTTPKGGIKFVSRKSQFVSEIYEALGANLNLIDELLAEVTNLSKGGKHAEAKRLLTITQKVIDSNKEIEKVVRLYLPEMK